MQIDTNIKVIMSFTTLTTPENLFKNNIILFCILQVLLCTWHNLCFFIIKNKIMKVHIGKLNLKRGLICSFSAQYILRVLQNQKRRGEKQETKQILRQIDKYINFSRDTCRWSTEGSVNVQTVMCFYQQQQRHLCITFFLNKSVCLRA